MNKIFFLLIVIPIISFSQSTYYVDSANGNDSNNGLNESTAWKTISKVNNQSFNAGDYILFKRDEIWNGERLYLENIIGDSANNITYSAYGNGEKPIISSVISQIHNWTYTSNNIWKATNPPDEHPERLLINGIEKLRANIISELDGVNYFWFYDNDTHDFYIHTTEDPINIDISYSTDFPMIIGDSNNITIENLDFQGGWTAIYITTMSKNIHLQNLNIGKYSREGIIISTDSTTPSDFPENILIQNCNVDAFFTFDYSTAAAYEDSHDRGCSDGIRAEVLLNSEIQDCYLKNWGHASISISGENISNIKVFNNYLTSPDICYGGRIAVDDATNVEIYNNEIINTSVQSQLNGQSNHYHHNIFFGTKDTPLIPDIIDAGIELQGYSSFAVTNNVFENNIILNTQGPALRISGNNNFNITNNTFRNNLIYNCGLAINGKSIVIEEDEFGSTSDNSFNNNLIYNQNTTQTCEFRNSLQDVLSFNSISEDRYQIANNIADNPLFVDIDNGDYHLTANSPCINSGTTVIATLDFEGNTIPYNATAPDIGIYEYQNSLGLEDQTIQENIILFPNPTTNFTQLKGIELNSIQKISLTDINGKIVFKNILINQSISISSLSKGVYFINITTSNNTIITRKIIIK